MNHRRISDKIRLVMDLMDHNDLLEDDPEILFLDFHPFDNLSHKLTFDTLSDFKFGQH